MPSTSLADYQVLMGGSATIEYDLSNSSFPRSLERVFMWPDDLHTNGGSRRPVVTFNIQPISDARFDIWLNNQLIRSELSFNASHTRSHSQAFEFERPLANGIPADGKVPFRIRMREGRAVFSDIVVWYQINR